MSYEYAPGTLLAGSLLSLTVGCGAAQTPVSPEPEVARANFSCDSGRYFIDTQQALVAPRLGNMLVEADSIEIRVHGGDLKRAPAEDNRSIISVPQKAAQLSIWAVVNGERALCASRVLRK